MASPRKRPKTVHKRKVAGRTYSPNWGGRRPGAGRKPKGDKAGVSHVARPSFGRLPIHVTMRFGARVGDLRSKRAQAIVQEALSLGAERCGARIVQIAIAQHQVELIVEAPTGDALSRAIQGFSIRVAKGLNRMLGVHGRVFTDRFEARALRTPADVRRAVGQLQKLGRPRSLELPAARNALLRRGRAAS
jgi:putative transposase